jgi:TolB-like protein
MRIILPPLLLFCLIPVPVAGQRHQHGETFDDAIVRVASTIAPRVEGRTIAVFEFPDLENRITNLSRLVSEQLTTELVQQTIGRARVLERRQVLQVLTELNLLRTDLTAEQVSQVGRQLGADAIVLGSATTLGTRVLVNARVVAVTGGEVLAAERLSVEAPQELLALASAGIGGPTLTPGPKLQADTQPPASGPAPHASARAAGPPPRPQASHRSLTMTIDVCTRSSNRLTCTLQVLNTGDQDQNLTLTVERWSQFTRIVDGNGNEYRADSIGIANAQPDFLPVRRTLVAGVTTQVRLFFDTEDTRVDRIALLELVGYWGDDEFVLRVRDVAVR